MSIDKSSGANRIYFRARGGSPVILIKIIKKKNGTVFDTFKRHLGAGGKWGHFQLLKTNNFISRKKKKAFVEKEFIPSKLRLCCARGTRAPLQHFSHCLIKYLITISDLPLVLTTTVVLINTQIPRRAVFLKGLCRENLNFLL